MSFWDDFSKNWITPSGVTSGVLLILLLGFMWQRGLDNETRSVDNQETTLELIKALQQTTATMTIQTIAITALTEAGQKASVLNQQALLTQVRLSAVLDALETRVDRTEDRVDDTEDSIQDLENKISP